MSLATDDRIEQQWKDFLALVDEITEDVADDPRLGSPLLQAEVRRHMLRLLAHGSLWEVEAHNPAYPAFFKWSMWLNWGGLNPDGLHEVANVDGEYTYRIFGNRGSASVFDIEVWSGEMGSRAREGHNLGGLCHVQWETDKNDLTFGEDGDFEVFLGGEERGPNRLPLPPGPSIVVVRQIFSDWYNEQLGQVYIERVGAAYPPPPETVDGLAERFRLLGDFLEWARVIKAGVAAQHNSLPPNQLAFGPIVFDEPERIGTGVGDQVDGSDHYYHRNFVMGYGNYACGVDEAVILEMDAPPAPLWNFYLCSHHGESFPWDAQQGSLNKHHAVIDPDGKLRIVISQRDPGVPNWLDPNDHECGLIWARIYRPTQQMADPTLRVVPFERLRESLPSTTPVVTAEARSEALRRRMHSVRRRGMKS